MKLDTSSAKQRFVELLKKYLLDKHPKKHTAADEMLEEAQFVHQMHTKHKSPDAVAVMLAQEEMGHTAVDHKDFFAETVRQIYQEVVKQMYEYFDSPEFTDDPMNWREVYANIFESVADSKAEQYAQKAAERNGLDEMPESEFWAMVSGEIEELTR